MGAAETRISHPRLRAQKRAGSLALDILSFGFGLNDQS